MFRLPFGAGGALAGVLVALSAAAALAGQEQRAIQERYPDSLTPEERELAARVAAEAIEERGLLTAAPLYLVDLELVRTKLEEAGAPVRQALVTHYRYEGDLAILALVDLGAPQAVQIDTVAHLPVPLAPEELENARRLALGNPEVREALTPYRGQVEVEPLLSRAAAETDRFFGHRVVRLLFRVPTGYLDAPIVYVDLTTEEVVIEE